MRTDDPGWGLASETAPLRRVLMAHARDAFVDQATLDARWRALNYIRCPDYTAACRESDALADLLTRLGCAVELAPADARVDIDGIYVRDAAVMGPTGAVLAGMGKPARETEPAAMGGTLTALGIPVLGALHGDARLEGGDLVWFDDGAVAIGEGYRSNRAGIERFAALTGTAPIAVPLPHWNGPDDVLHLMSFLSPLAPDLMLVWSRLMPVVFRRWLLDRGYRLVEVPDAEYDSMGCNVLAVRPGVVIAVDGNPETRRRMEAAGCEVHVYVGEHISLPGSGGPTCLTRPLARG